MQNFSPFDKIISSLNPIKPLKTFSKEESGEETKFRISILDGRHFLSAENALLAEKGIILVKNYFMERLRQLCAAQGFILE